jgi:hypothetical protein
MSKSRLAESRHAFGSLSMRAQCTCACTYLCVRESTDGAEAVRWRGGARRIEWAGGGVGSPQPCIYECLRESGTLAWPVGIGQRSRSPLDNTGPYRPLVSVCNACGPRIGIESIDPHDPPAPKPSALPLSPRRSRVSILPPIYNGNSDRCDLIALPYT